jgi:general secretion pathway protein L
VQLPSRPAAAPERWLLGEMSFVVTGASSHVLQQGRSTRAGMPRAAKTILVMPAPDVLLLEARWPGLESLPPARIREALPNILEEHLIQPAEQCHFAYGLRDAATQTIPVAVVDRAWMRFVYEAFADAEGGTLEIIPAQFLQPINTLQSEETSSNEPYISGMRSIIWRSGRFSGIGLRVASGADGSIIPGIPAGLTATPRPSFEKAVSAGVTDRLDLCQFEFAPRSSLQRQLRPWKTAAFIALVALLLQVLAQNLYWARLAWQKQSLVQSMNTLLHDTLPNASGDVAPASALQRALDTRRMAAGGASAGDFSMLVAQLTQLMSGEPGDAVARLDYSNQSLVIRFKTGYSADPLVKKASARGVMLHEDGKGNWRLTGATR